ncbi:MAG: oligosaccharide flippase family protein [Verrucomicrobia bacterium]|nr:oligosaccharide flippase family protein [Verrucomicrobiota bacterium]
MSAPLRAVYQYVANLFAGRGLRSKVATLAGGTAFAQVLAVAVSPVLSRLYAPAEFGILAVLASTAGLLGVGASLRYQVAIPLPQENRPAKELLRISLGLALASTLVISGLVFGLAPRFFAWLQVPEAADYWWFIPLATGGMAVYESLYHWILRLRDYRRLMRTRVWQSTSNAAASIALGLGQQGPLGLLVGGILFQAAGVGSLLRAVHAAPDTDSQPNPHPWRSAVRTAREYAAFALFGCPAALLNASGLLLPPLIIVGLYGTEAGGAFSFAFRFVSVPMALVGTAVSQVFLAEASPLLAQRPAEVRALFNRFVLRLLPFSLALMLGGLICPWVFPPVFGADWAQAGWFAAFLAFSCAAQMLVSPVSNIAVLTRRQGFQLGLDLLRVMGVGLSLWGSFRLGATATQAVAAYAGTMLLLYGIYFLSYRRMARGLSPIPPVKGAAERNCATDGPPADAGSGL